MPGIPVGTSLIDAHAGGVGVIESVPSSEAEGCHDLIYTCDCKSFRRNNNVLNLKHLCILRARQGSNLQSHGVSLWYFYMPHGCITEQIVHSRGLGAILVR